MERFGAEVYLPQYALKKSASRKGFWYGLPVAIILVLSLVVLFGARYLFVSKHKINPPQFQIPTP